MECFRRAENDLWILQTYQGLEAIARLECVEINAPLADIYATVDFTVAENENEF